MQACKAERHGDTYIAYARWGCRCPAARRARKQYNVQKQAGTFQPERIDGTGTRRRVRALMALGWSQTEIARHLGRERSIVHHLSKADTIFRSSAELIAEAYAELSMRKPPRSREATQARLYAQRQGWAPPLAWDDIDDPSAKPRGVRKAAA